MKIRPRAHSCRSPALARRVFFVALLALTLGRALGAADSVDWDALTPDALKRPEPVELPRNPLQPSGTGAEAQNPANRPAPASFKGLVEFARSKIQGVVRDPAGEDFLVWENRVYVPGQALRPSEGTPWASHLIQLKAVRANAVVLVARAPADEASAPVEVLIPLPLFFCAR